MRHRQAIVLHTPAMEPITVVEMPAEALMMMHEHGTIHARLPDGGTVEIEAVEVNALDGKAWVYITSDEALSLPAGFLPGQRALVWERDRLMRRARG